MAYPGSQTKITITHDREATGDLQSQYITQVMSKEMQISQLQSLINAVGAGARNAQIALVIDDGNPVSASGTITLSGVGAANDTILINGVTFTAQASGATGNQWNVGASATLSAANIAAAINASASALVNQHVTASAASGVVTIRAAIAGLAGNAVTIAKGVDAGTVMTVSGARLTGGVAATNSSSVSYNHGV
jgi:phage tail sheath gpL-like